jgi:nitrogen regulatory protein P-II 2
VLASAPGNPPVWHGSWNIPGNDRQRRAATGGQKAMKLIMAVIRPFKLDDVRAALAELNVSGVTVTEARGYGRQRGHTEIYRGAEYAINFVPKVRIEVAVPEALAERTMEAIQRSANTGRIGDGKIFVFGITQAVRIRTGETDSAAL